MVLSKSVVFINIYFRLRFVFVNTIITYLRLKIVWCGGDFSFKIICVSEMYFKTVFKTGLLAKN